MAFLKIIFPFIFVFTFINKNIGQQNKFLAHDPVMIKQDSTYYLFITGPGITNFSSTDMINWEKLEPVFAKPPAWANEAIKGFGEHGHIWAPDIAYHNGLYYLYYSVSAFGKNTSCIGLATNKTLNPNHPDFKWEDHGKVIQSVPGRDLFNAIDPNLAFDDNGTPWLSFGSFWAGLKLVKLNNELTAPAQPEEWYTIAKRPRPYDLDDANAGPGAIEAPFIFKKNNYYYLFVSYDYCCKGKNSTYKIMVGRSGSITGPYVDKEGVKMTSGGASLVLQGDENWYAVGHNSVYTFNEKDYLVFHGYDANDKGLQRLIIKQIEWDDEGWPVIIKDK